MSDAKRDSFAQLRLPAEQLANLQRLGYHAMTPIQAKSLPRILQRKDAIAQAKTGSGKTAAFGLGVLQSIDPRPGESTRRRSVVRDGVVVAPGVGIGGRPAGTGDHQQSQ
jgi:superfamily II DNA/RNA helicase